MSAHSIKAFSWSALLHLVVIAVLWYTQQPVSAPVAQPKAIQAFVYQPIPRPAKPPILNSAEVLPEALATPQKTAPRPASKVKTQPKVIAEPPRAARQKTEHTAAPSEEAPSDDSHLTTDATHTTKPIQATGTPLSLAERSLAIANRRHTDVSSAALAASQQRPERRDRPATTAKVQLKPEHAADNVLMVLSDGSFIEKIGDYCYHANYGANLRADISSMKPVPCGKDKNAAMYERIMSKVGQDR